MLYTLYWINIISFIALALLDRKCQGKQCSCISKYANVQYLESITSLSLHLLLSLLRDANFTLTGSGCLKAAQGTQHQ